MYTFTFLTYPSWNDKVHSIDQNQTKSRWLKQLHDFYSSNTKLGKEYWRCEKRTLCSVWLHMVTEINEPKMIYFYNEHLHPAVVKLIKCLKSSCRNKIIKWWKYLFLRKYLGFSANQGVRTGLEMPEKYCKLHNGKQFLTWDSGIEDQQLSLHQTVLCRI